MKQFLHSSILFALSIFLMCAFCASTKAAESTTQSSANAILFGDVNQDGFIDNDDVLLTMQISGGIITPDEKQKISADINRDGTVGIFDAVLLLKYCSEHLAEDSNKGTFSGIADDFGQTTIMIPLATNTEWGPKLENGKMDKTPALRVCCFDAKEEFIIPVSTENNNPATVYNSETDCYDFSAYTDRMCTCCLDETYTLQRLVNESNTDAKAAAALSSDDENAQFGFTAGYNGKPANIYFKKVTGTTYEFQTDQGESANILPNGVQYVTVMNGAKIFIQSKNKDDQTIYSDFNMQSLPSISKPFVKLECLLVNNPSSTKNENIAILYGVIDGMITDVMKPFSNRENLLLIKANDTIDIDIDGVYHYYYHICKPYTAETEDGLPGIKGATYSSKLSSPATIGKFYEGIDGQLWDDCPSALNDASVFKPDGSRIAPQSTVITSGVLEITGCSLNVLTVKGIDHNFLTDSDTTVILLDAGGKDNNDFKWAKATPKIVDRSWFRQPILAKLL